MIGDLYAQGLSIEAISKKTGFDRKTVHKYLNTTSIPEPKNEPKKRASVMSTTQCRGTEGVKTDAKNDATAQKRGTFLHHERETQNVL